jgi:hypothetical protein
MASFSDFSNILPDPINKIGGAGQIDATGSSGPGFSSVVFKSVDNFLQTRTGAGSLNVKNATFHKWEVNIKYHPMTREEFDPVYTFLMHRRTLMQPFYVVLPQYAGQTTVGNTTIGEHLKWSVELNVNSAAATAPPQIFSLAGNPKIYMINRVESTGDYYQRNPQPGVEEERYHITPGLVVDTSTGVGLNFTTPMLYVRQVGDTIKYSLDSKNLYSFSLTLEEVLTNV